MASGMVLLLGAGASKEAGAPLATEIVQKFAEHIASSDPQHVGLLNYVLARLRRHTEQPHVRRVLDVELLLEALDNLQPDADHALLAFIERGAGSDGEATIEGYRHLRVSLRAFLRKALDIAPNATKYLDPILACIPEKDALEVFTLNYDTTIEQVCHRSGVPYTDGFDAYWNPLLFDDPRFQIRLNKLHGSLLWYQGATSSPDLVRIALRPTLDLEQVEHFAHESLRDVLIYPGGPKEVFREPYVTLMERFRRCLSGEKVLVAVGTSFRDPHIRATVLEQMQKNPDLMLAVVDPEAGETVSASDDRFVDRLSFRTFRDRIVMTHQTTSEAMKQRGLLELAGWAGYLRRQRSYIHRTLRQDEENEQLKATEELLEGFVRTGKMAFMVPVTESLSVSGVYDSVGTFLNKLGTNWNPRPAELGGAAVFLDSPLEDLRQRAEAAMRRLVHALAGGVVYESSAGERRVILPRFPVSFDAIAKDQTEFLLKQARAIEAAVRFLLEAKRQCSYLGYSNAFAVLEVVAEDLILAARYFTSVPSGQEKPQIVEGFPVVGTPEVRLEIGGRIESRVGFLHWE